jgi:hypothetical protein
VSKSLNKPQTETTGSASDIRMRTFGRDFGQDLGAVQLTISVSVESATWNLNRIGLDNLYLIKNVCQILNFHSSEWVTENTQPINLNLLSERF